MKGEASWNLSNGFKLQVAGEATAKAIHSFYI